MDLNAAAAARRAGYSSKNADKIGAELLGKTRVRAEIDLLKAERSDRLRISADSVLREISEIAFANPFDCIEIINGHLTVRSDLIPNPGKFKSLTGIAIGRGAINLQFGGKLKALELLLRHLNNHPKSSENNESLSETINRLLNNYKVRKTTS